MKIENSFTIDAPVEDAWALLTNIPEIAPCLPGAKLSGEEDGVYSGAVKIKVGPVTAEYRGTAEFVERDDVAHKAVINGKGRDSRGAGNAQALITAEMQERDGQTQVDIITDLKITGKVAQFGRGVMQDVSEKLLGQFAECLAGKLEGPSLDDIAAASAELESAAPVSEAEAAGTAIDGATEKAADIGKGVAGAAGGAKAAAAGGAAMAGAGAGAAAAASRVTGNDDDDDDDALDLLEVAGGAVFKRFIPVLAIAAIVIALLVIFVL